MQEIITWSVIVAAVFLVGIRMVKSAKSFKKSDQCNGCDSSCDGCPIAPGNKKERKKLS